VSAPYKVERSFTSLRQNRPVIGICGINKKIEITACWASNSINLLNSIKLWHLIRLLEKGTPASALASRSFRATNHELRDFSNVIFQIFKILSISFL
jgi:hypothetical protein